MKGGFGSYQHFAPHEDMTRRIPILKHALIAALPVLLRSLSDTAHVILAGDRSLVAVGQSLEPLFIRLRPSGLFEFLEIYSVRNRLSFVLSVLVAFAIALPSLIYAQQGEAQKPARGGSVDRPAAASRAAGRAPASSNASAEVEQDIAEALTIIQDNYVDGSKLDYNTIFKSSITGMLRVLDPHSNYFDRSEFDEFRADQRSEYYGIGATIGDLRNGEEVNTYIRATFQNSPAARVGLRFGDRIVEVNGESVRNKPYTEVRDSLRGPRGSIVKVTVEHNGTKQVETVEIKRDAVPQPSIPESYMIRPGVGYVAMTGGFNLTTADEFQDALEDLRSKGMNMLILDLRGNGGGLLYQAVRVANTFLQRGQLILTQKGRTRENSQVYRAENESPDSTPLVVLVNRGTASASEIVAGALQDHDRALIVGETSFGKGLVQNPFILDYGSALMLTIAKYYTPSGRLIQRDYSNGGFYDYYTRGGSYRSERKSEQAQPTGPESRTDTGRAVYGGGGISPDETVEPRVITPAQQRLMDPIFAFALELTSGRVRGFDTYKVQGAIDFSHDLKATDFPITDAVYKAFKDFVQAKTSYKIPAAQLDRERAFIERQMRYDLATAAYGTVTAFQVFNVDDPQIARAVDVLPRARELALAAKRAARNPSE
jgi:carboxyl-terminal processing protease